MIDDLSFIVAPQALHLWRVALDRLPGNEEQAWLSGEEQARAARFAFERDRRRFLAAHCALRRLLGAHLDHDPGLLRFETGPHGKPALARPAGRCSFNMSHSEDVALILAGREGDLGVDVERLRELPEAERLAACHFTAGEADELRRAAPGRGRQQAFLAGWTRKESCLKALGCGLSIEPHSFETGLALDGRRVTVRVGGRVAELHVQSFCHRRIEVGAVARVIGWRKA